MRQADRLLRFGEILDRAVVIFFRTLNRTARASIFYFFAPIFTLQAIELLALHSRWVERYAFGYIDDLFGAIGDIAIITILSAELNGRRVRSQELCAIIKRNAMASIVIVIGCLFVFWLGAEAILAPFWVWKFTAQYRVDVRFVFAALGSPVAILGIGLLATTYFFATLALITLIEEHVDLFAAFRAASRRLTASGNRLRTGGIALVSFTILAVAYGLELYSSRIIALPPHVIRPIVGWPFSVFVAAIAVVFNRDARNRYEGFDLELARRLISLGGTQPQAEASPRRRYPTA